MKINTAMMTLLALAGSFVQAIPIDKCDASTSYEITSPVANSTLQVNQNAVISWNKGTDNSPINIGLIAGSDTPLSSSSIVISEGISGSIGTVVYVIPSSLGNSTNAWRVAISHGSDPVIYSAPFYISNHGPQQVQQQQPSFTASASNATYSAQASIDILGPDGSPLPKGGSSDASSIATTFAITNIFVSLAVSGYLFL
ncbi:hypothetical protein BCR42DRAFT_419536 [Absidia repens]|uniref:Yeast cell wall synthesis Kre9/Knh1-like N-terminal domain-containing protein n=1 Tax=Absidia repens TaxID=90262 RepID=A0A1X2IBG0_9FUNG|nr:hypothetical protein BCR42DRAFT_419536 [Absidia repens]